jgi:hypothetical protein
MLGAILRAAVNWMERGLPLKLLKIVIYSEGTARDLMETFIASKNQHRTETDEAPPVSALSTDTQYDLFLSYAHEEADAAYYMVHRIKEYSRAVRIFHDKVSIREGSTWLMQIAYALDS